MRSVHVAACWLLAALVCCSALQQRVGSTRRQAAASKRLGSATTLDSSRRMLSGRSLTADGTYSPATPDGAEMATALLGAGSGLELLESSYVGAPSASGLITFPSAHALYPVFATPGSSSIPRAVVLTSGGADIALRTADTLNGAGVGIGNPGDALLDAVLGQPSRDAARLNMRVRATSNGILRFSYVFASEEYPEYINLFNDGFLLMVSVNGGPAQNVALVPGTTTPVTINTVNGGYNAIPPVNSEYFRNGEVANSGIEYDGYTVLLRTADVAVSTNDVIDLVFVVADAGDTIFDSAVYIQAESLTINTPPVAKIGDGEATTITAVCGTPLTLTSTSFDPDSSDALAHSWTLTGNGYAGLPAGTNTATTLGPLNFEGAVDADGKFTAYPFFTRSSTEQTYQVTLQVTDSVGAVGSTTVDLVIPVCNQPPVVVVTSPTPVVSGGSVEVACNAAISLDASASTDADGDSLTFTWELKNAANAVVATATGATASINATTGGTFTLLLTVSDGQVTVTAPAITVVVGACPPDCSHATAQPSVWPPNNKLTSLAGISGVTDPANLPLTFTYTSVTQDEPVKTRGGGNLCPTAVISADKRSVQIGAQREGTGDGRVYKIGFTATNSGGTSCSSVVTVCVPHDQGKLSCVDSGATYDSTVCA